MLIIEFGKLDIGTELSNSVQWKLLAFSQFYNDYFVACMKAGGGEYLNS